MLITFKYSDNTEEKISLEGDNLEAIAAILGYYYPPKNIDKDKYIVQTIVTQWCEKIGDVVKDQVAQEQSDEIAQRIEDRLSSMIVE